MIDNPFYSHEYHGDYKLISIGRLDLEDGGSIPTASSQWPRGASSTRPGTTRS